MSSTQLIAFFDQRRARGRRMVLVTVIETAGSTYSKTGARMLIDEDDQFHGMVSGGCLEGDLVEHAHEVSRSGLARTVTYDLQGPADELWGLGLGCDGLIRLLLQPLSADQNYEPMNSIARALQSESPHAVEFVAESDHAATPLGTTFLREIGVRHSAVAGAAARGQAIDPASSLRRQGAEETPAGPGVTRLSGVLDGGRMVVLEQLLLPLPRVLILGAGVDAVPVAEGFLALGWRVMVGDHREHALNQSAFGSASRLHLADDDALRTALRDSPPSAIILMTHNLQRDIRYLEAVAFCDSVYVGALGPRRRRDKLLDALSAPARALVSSRLRGPAGLELDADSPASIALSIVAEVYAEIKKSQVSAKATRSSEPGFRERQH